MLTIQDEQMRALRDSKSETFHLRVIEFVGRTLSPTLLPIDKAELKDATARAIGAATTQGIGRESYVVGFVCLYLIFGPDFHRDAPFDAIWQRPTDPESKVADSLRTISISEQSRSIHGNR